MNYLDQASYAFDVVFLWACETRPIFIMDNHLCAAWCWLQKCNSKKSYNFMHIDRHPDLKGCGHPHIIDFLKRKPHITFEKYMAITYDNGYICQFFQWDNYIRACQYLFPNWFKLNLFYTQKPNECKDNDWGYKHFPIQTMNPFDVCDDITLYIQNSRMKFSSEEICNNKWILNIDLDFFWNHDRDKLFDDVFIRDLARRINNSIDNIEVITMALSPDCVGGGEMKERWANAFKALDIFKEEIDGLGDFTIPC